MKYCTNKDCKRYKEHIRKDGLILDSYCKECFATGFNYYSKAARTKEEFIPGTDYPLHCEPVRTMSGVRFGW